MCQRSRCVSLAIRRWIRRLLVLCMVGSSPARAGTDVFGLGDGHRGPLTVTTAQTVNLYTSLTSSVAAGQTVLQVASTTGFVAGDLVMLHHSTGTMAYPLESPTPVSPA